MRSAVQIFKGCLWVLVLALQSSAQVAISAGPQSSIGEPENHAIGVDRLVRYHDSGEYERDIRDVANAGRDYLESRYPKVLPEESKVAVVFDIDETALSNWDVMAACGFCSYPTQLQLYKDGLYSNAHDPAIVPILELFNFAKAKGIAVFFVTGRPLSQLQLTKDNLIEAGFVGWKDLIMTKDAMQPSDKEPARVFKPKARKKIEDAGYRIVLNIGDQASDLSGCCAEKTFKLPNPFYLIP